MPAFKAIAFDFDGTIADAVPLHYPARVTAFQQMFHETGDVRYMQVTEAMQREAHKHGSSPVTIIGWVLQEIGVVARDADLHTDPTVALVVSKKNAAYDELVADGAPEIPGALSVLRKAAEEWQDACFIVTTARLQEEVLPFMKRHNIDGLFPPQRLITREDVESSQLKPDPAAYNLAIERAGLATTPNQLLAIEDSAHGIEAAKRAGATVYAIATSLNTDELTALSGYQKPDSIVVDMSELRKVLFAKH